MLDTASRNSSQMSFSLPTLITTNWKVVFFVLSNRDLNSHKVIYRTTSIVLWLIALQPISTSSPSEPSQRSLIQDVSDWCIKAYLCRWSSEAPLYQCLVWSSWSGGGKWITDRTAWFLNAWHEILLHHLKWKVGIAVLLSWCHSSYFLFFSPLQSSQTNSWMRESILWRSGKVSWFTKLNTTLNNSLLTVSLSVLFTNLATLAAQKWTTVRGCIKVSVFSELNCVALPFQNTQSRIKSQLR